MTARSPRSPLGGLAVAAGVSIALACALVAARSAAGPAPSTSGAGRAPAAPSKPMPLASVALPSEKSPTPKLDEWSAAPLIELTENAEKARCRARVVREWLKIHCDGAWGVIRQVAGPSSDVVFWIAPPPEGEVDSDGAEIVVALRRGDRRVIQMFGLSAGYEGPGWPFPANVVEERWDEGDDHPTVVLR